MQDFQVHIPTRIFFGQSNGMAFAEAVASQAKNVLLVTGSGSVERLGYRATVEAMLKEVSCTAVLFSGVEPNPDVTSINEAAALGRERGVDGVLALGGGSAMDAAKAIACLIATGEEDIWPFVAGQARQGELQASLPVFAIPTTAATASEVTPFAVISNRAERGKAPIAYDFIKPYASWLNPAFTQELPLKVTQDGAADILSHVFENYLIGGAGAVLSDRYCEAIIKTVVETLPLLAAEPKNLDLRAQLLWCSTLALNGLQVCGRTQAGFPLHAIEHAMSAVVPDLAHGRGLATLFPAYFRWLLENARAEDRLARLAVEIFSEPSSAERFIARFEEWLATNGLLQSASQLGIGADDYDFIAEQAIATSGSAGQLQACGPLRKEGIAEILKLSEQQRR